MEKAVFLILLLASCASALNDAYIHVDTASTGLCYSLGDPDHPVCDGAYVRVNGTSDHDLYVVNGYSGMLDLNISAIKNQTQMDAVMETWMVDPWYIFLGLGGGALFAVIFLGGGWIAACHIADHLPG